MLRAFALVLLLAAGAPAHAAPPTADEWLLRVQDAYTRAVIPGEQAAAHRDLLAVIWQRTLRSHANEVNPEPPATAALAALAAVAPGTGDPARVFAQAINQALRALDANSRYLDAAAVANERSDGAFGGLGLEVESTSDGVRVIAPMPDSPAERAGLQAGDLIVRIDGQPSVAMPLAEAVARMRGEPGTPVALVVQRGEPAQEIPFQLLRQTIQPRPVQAGWQGDVLVLRVAAFSAGVSEAVERAVAQAAAVGEPRAVVLDLRGNGGGLVREAVKLADAFLAEGTIVTLRGRPPLPERQWKADPAQLLPGTPMVVLIDRRSASASEIVAAALQDHARAVVVGQRSYGKGTVQVTYPLGAQNGALKLTTSRYFTPAGRSVHGEGVTPQVELKDTKRCAVSPGVRDEALSCAIAFLHAGSAEVLEAATSSLQP